MSYRRRHGLRVILVLIGLYALVGFILLPRIVRTQLEQRLSVLLGRPVTVGVVWINPFTLSATLDRVDVATADGRASLAGWDRLYVNFDAPASIAHDWTFSEIALDGFHAAVEVRSDGSTNFSDILQKFLARAETPAAASAGGSDALASLARPVRIARLSITDARIAYVDASRPKPFYTLVGPVNFTLLDFQTAGGHGAPYRLEAATEAGERISWSGTLTAAPLRSSGELRIENLQLAKYAPYFGDRLNAVVDSGQLSLDGRYEASFEPGSRRLTFDDGAVEGRHLRLLERDGQPLLDLESLEITGLAADVFASRVTAGAVHLTGGRVALRRMADGAINLATLFAPPNLSAPPSPLAPVMPPLPAAPPAPFRLAIGEIALRDFAVAVRDQTAPRPVQLGLTDVNATLENFSLAPGAALPVTLTCNVPPQGTGRLTGRVVLAPFHADLEVTLAQIPLAPLGPYLEQIVRVRVEKGTGSLTGRAQLAIAGDGPPRLDFHGSGRLADCAIADAAHDADFAGCSQLAVDGIAIVTAPRLAVSVRDARIVAPYGHAVVDEKGGFNLAGLIATGPPSPPAGAAEEAAEISVAQAEITEGNFSFADHSVKPAVQFTLAETNAQLRGFATSRAGPCTLELHGLLNGQSPVTARGRVGWPEGQLSAEVTVDGGGDLQPAAPYLAKYAGYQLTQGRLTFATRAKVAGEQVDAQNTVTLEDFALGARSGSPEAVKLPVRLGVALLKGPDGKIVLHIPVQGRLTDPNFHFGAVVGHVLTGLLTQATTAPFTLLGSMFGGGGEDLARPEFVPGETVLTAASLKRLKTVQRALANRPALRLEIEGGYDAAVDALALKRAKVDAMVRQRVWDERHDSQSDLPPPEKLVVSEAGRDAALQALFAGELSGTTDAADTAPEQVQAPAPVSATVEPEAPPPPAEADAPPHRSLLSRAWDTLTLKPVRRKISRTLDSIIGHHERKPPPAKAPPAKPPPRPTPPKVAPPSPPPARAPELPVEEIERRLMASLRIAPNDLRGLAAARAWRVREELIGDGKIAPERVTIAKTVEKNGARVTLHLQ